MMKSIVLFFLIFSTSAAYTQNEWWKSESDSSKQEIKQKPKPIKKIKRDYSKLVFIDTNKIDTNTYKEPETFQPGKTTVEMSPLIAKIIKFKSATIPPYSGPVMDGYRIQLFFDQSRKEVDKARSIALGIDSDTPTYIQYKAPNYFLLLGNYRTELKAEKVRSTMIAEFPAALVVKDKIYLPSIKIEKEEQSKD